MNSKPDVSLSFTNSITPCLFGRQATVNSRTYFCVVGRREFVEMLIFKKSDIIYLNDCKPEEICINPGVWEVRIWLGGMDL